MKPEEQIQQRILRELSRGPVRLFRQPTGSGWVGQLVSYADGMVVLRAASRVTFGLAVGSGDLIGWLTRPDGVAQFVSLEVKSKEGRPEPEQIVWDAAVRKAGGLTGIVRSVEEARLVVGV